VTSTPSTCYRRTGGFSRCGRDGLDTDRVRIVSDDLVELVRRDGSVVKALDPKYMARYAAACVEQGLWYTCADRKVTK
jgi:hypothetical protein